MKYVVVGLSLVLSLSLISCSKKNSGAAAASDASNSTDAATTPRTKYLASNVVFSSSELGTSSFSSVQRSAASVSSNGNASKVDTSTKILAEDIIFDDPAAITTDSSGSSSKKLGRLKSKNLKSALQNEVAPDASSSIVGTWDVVNRGGDFDNTAGVVTFTDTEIQLVSGNVDSFYLRNYPDPNTYMWGIPSGTITYKMISNGVILVNYSRNGQMNYFAPIVVMDSKTQMTMVITSTDSGVTSSKVAVMKKRITVEEKAAQAAEGLGDDDSSSTPSSN